MQNTKNFDTIKRKEQGISNVAVFSLVKERRNPANKSSNRAPHTSSYLNVAADIIHWKVMSFLLFPQCFQKVCIAGM